MRNERTMNAVAVADEADNICSFIFKNSWAVNNLDKICGQHSSQMARPEFELGKVVEAKVNLDSERSQGTWQGSESLRRPGPLFLLP
jgi:hypothetical protein